MKAAIIGYGSIGRRHLGNIRNLYPDAEILVCHLRSSSTDIPEGANAVVHGLEALALRRPDVAFVTGPANTHLGAAEAMRACGADLFIEKPLSTTLDGIDSLIRTCASSGIILMLGYVLRFHAPLQLLRNALHQGMIGRTVSVRAEVGQYLPDWRPHLDYRESVTAKSSLGGGVLLELSHEFDYLRWILGDFTGVSAHLGKLSDLDIDVEDTAEVILTSERRELVSVHLDMVQRAGGRFCQITGTEGTLKWSSGTGHVQAFLAQEGTWKTLRSDPQTDRNDMFISELQHFFDCVTTRNQPIVGGEDGRSVLKIIEGARRSSAEGRVVSL